MLGGVVILSSQILTLLTYHWSSAGLLATKTASVKELLGKLQTCKGKEFVTREQTFS